MAVKRMDNVGIVVDDLTAAIDFFRELGLELEGRDATRKWSVNRVQTSNNRLHHSIVGEWAGRVWLRLSAWDS